MTLRRMVNLTFLIIGLYLLADLALSLHDATEVMPEYFTDGNTGLVVAVLVFTAPVSCLLLSALVTVKAHWAFIAVPVIHAIVVFPLAALPAVLLVYDHVRNAQNHEQE